MAPGRVSALPGVFFVFSVYVIIDIRGMVSIDRLTNSCFGVELPRFPKNGRGGDRTHAGARLIRHPQTYGYKPRAIATRPPCRTIKVGIRALECVPAGDSAGQPLPSRDKRIAWSILNLVLTTKPSMIGWTLG